MNGRWPIIGTKDANMGFKNATKEFKKLSASGRHSHSLLVEQAIESGSQLGHPPPAKYIRRTCGWRNDILNVTYASTLKSRPSYPVITKLSRITLLQERAKRPSRENIYPFPPFSPKLLRDF